MQSDRLAVTTNRSCLIESSGDLLCWGRGGSIRFTAGSGLPRFVTLSGGSSHLCGLTGDSTAYCWDGSNRYGEIGDGSQSERSLPTKVATDLKFVWISAAVFTTCALDGAGRAYCWGTNELGGIGNGTMGELSVETLPTPVASQVRFTAVDGAYPNCGLSLDRAVYCWGMVSGSFDPNHLQAPGDCTNAFFRWYAGRDCLRPTPVSTALRFATLAADRCGVTDLGEAYCWGDGFYGTFGDGRVGVYSVLPVRVSGAIQFRKLTSGSHHVCGIDLVGKAYCWGNNFVGQLGIGEHGSGGGVGLRAEPTPVLTQERFVSIASKDAHTCALTAGEQVWCWGSNNFGQLGPGTPGHLSNIPVLVQLPPL
jgi:alpha-tubulin suppressor-like RCC1 family protein